MRLDPFECSPQTLQTFAVDVIELDTLLATRAASELSKKLLAYEHGNSDVGKNRDLRFVDIDVKTSSGRTGQGGQVGQASFRSGLQASQ